MALWFAAKAASKYMSIGAGRRADARERYARRKAKRGPSIGTMKVDIKVEASDITRALDKLEGKIKKYALERSFNDSERLLAKETLKAIKAVPRARKRPKKDKVPVGYMYMRKTLRMGSFKKRAVATKNGGFFMMQGVKAANNNIHWLEFGTYDGTKWPGFPRGKGPRYGTFDRLQKQIVEDVARRMKRQIDNFKTSGKLLTAKELRA